MLAVCYAQIADDKQSGVRLVGVFFGGLAQSQPEADLIAKDCVNTVKSGTVIPKMFQITTKGQLLAIMNSATVKFRKLEAEMIETESIINRTRRRR